MFFESHGDFVLTVKDDLLIIRVGGAWNAECAKEFTSKARELVTESFIKENQPFNALCVIGEDWLPTFDAKEFFPIITQWGIKNGLKREAFVFKTNISKVIMEDLLLPSFDNSLSLAFFTSEEDAHIWLNNVQ